MTTTANHPTSPYLPRQRTYPEDPVLMVRELNNSFVDISRAVNSRDIAIYSQDVVATGQRFDFIPDSRSEESSRRLFSFGPIAAAATATLPLEFAGFAFFTRIYGVAQVATGFRPLPYATNIVGDNVELFVLYGPPASINITNSTVTAILSAIVVVEFV